MTIPAIQSQYRLTRELAKKVRNAAKNQRTTIAEAYRYVMEKQKKKNAA